MKNVFVLLSAFAVTSASVPREALAFDFLFPGSICDEQVQPPQYPTRAFHKGAIFGVTYMPNIQKLAIDCPIVTDSWLASSWVNTITLYTYEDPNHNGATVFACVAYHNAYGSSCGPWVNFAAGYQSTIVSESAWVNFPSGMPAVLAQLPHRAEVRGIRISDQ